MARFFFHYWDGSGYRMDCEGSELPDANAAYMEAFETAQQLAIDLIREGSNAMRPQMEVNDATGRRVFELPFSEVLGVRSAPSDTAAIWRRSRLAAADVKTQVAEARSALDSLREALSKF